MIRFFGFLINELATESSVTKIASFRWAKQARQTWDHFNRGFLVDMMSRLTDWLLLKRQISWISQSLIKTIRFVPNKKKRREEKRRGASQSLPTISSPPRASFRWLFLNIWTHEMTISNRLVRAEMRMSLCLPCWLSCNLPSAFCMLLALFSWIYVRAWNKQASKLARERSAMRSREIWKTSQNVQKISLSP